MPPNNIVHVAVAVIQNQHGQYLIAKRPDNVHQGGLWEFPGGKVESTETVLEALNRELDEEIGITFSKFSPLIQIQHDYGDKFVLLDVFRINDISGNAFGKEGQEILWIDPDKLNLYQFPVANIPIIKAIQLPDKYMITGEFSNENELLAKINRSLENEIKLIQFRAHCLAEETYFNFAKKIYKLCKQKNAKLILNTSPGNFNQFNAENYSDGLHLTSKEIKNFTLKSISSDLLVSTSIHDHEELSLAEKIGVDFAVLSPVKKTLSHPDSLPLGWGIFKELSQKAIMPVYALGGMTTEDIGTAITHGGQGIAAIGEFWNS